MEDSDRVGVPGRAFENLRDYIDTVADFQPVFVMRDGKPVVLKRYNSFNEYFNDKNATGIDMHGQEVSLRPEDTDFDLHLYQLLVIMRAYPAILPSKTGLTISSPLKI